MWNTNVLRRYAALLGDVAPATTWVRLRRERKGRAHRDGERKLLKTQRPELTP